MACSAAAAAEGACPRGHQVVVAEGASFEAVAAVVLAAAPVINQPSHKCYTNFLRSTLQFNVYI